MSTVAEQPEPVVAEFEAWLADVERYQDARRQVAVAELDALHAAATPEESEAITDAVLAACGVDHSRPVDERAAAAVRSIHERRRRDCERFMERRRELLREALEALCRTCACGCGTALTDRRSQTIYATDACRKRVARAPDRATHLLAALRAHGPAGALAAFDALPVPDRALVVHALGLHGEDILGFVLDGTDRE